VGLKWDGKKWVDEEWGRCRFGDGGEGALMWVDDEAETIRAGRGEGRLRRGKL